MTETIFAQNAYLSLPSRAIVGLALALGAAGLARRAGSLERGGGGFVAATVCGTLCVIGGWSWSALLILYFGAATALSRFREEEKGARTRGVVSKGGERDAAQVVANGGIFSLAAALTAILPAPYIAWGAVGALAAASADTWATEVGVWLGGRPRSIITGTNVRPGESGGVTFAGLMGSVAGAGWVALAAMLLGFQRGLGIASMVAGFGGAIVDSVVGATIQERRRCDVCDEPTEQALHLCGSATRRVGGIAWVNNDVVNLISTFAGFLLGLFVYYIVGRSGSWGGWWGEGGGAIG
ncbi:MAG TPA: DUF92 domain-containing protein [Gemmatimonadaceae bacterium]